MRLRCSSKVFLIEVCVMLTATEITQVWIAKTTWNPMPSMFSCGRGIITKCQKLIQLLGASMAHQQHAAKGSRNKTLWSSANHTHLIDIFSNCSWSFWIWMWSTRSTSSWPLFPHTPRDFATTHGHRFENCLSKSGIGTGNWSDRGWCAWGCRYQ